MSKDSKQVVSTGNASIPNIPKNLEVDSDKLGRPYARINGEGGNYYKQIKLKNKKTKRIMVSDE